MCVEIGFEDPADYPEQRIGTLGELRAHFGDFVTPEDYDKGQEDTYCLCGVDIEAVLNRAGVTWVLDDFMGEPLVLSSNPKFKRIPCPECGLRFHAQEALLEHGITHCVVEDPPGPPPYSFDDLLMED